MASDKSLKLKRQTEQLDEELAMKRALYELQMKQINQEISNNALEHHKRMELLNISIAVKEKKLVLLNNQNEL
jgi:hypothetical protein